MNEPDEPKQGARWLAGLALAGVLVGLLVARHWFGRALAGQAQELSSLPALFGVALALFALLVAARTLPKLDWGEGVEGKRPFSWPSFLRRYGRHLALASSVMLTYFLLWRLLRIWPTESYTAVFLLWVAAGGLYLVAFAPRDSLPRDWHGWLRENRPLLLGVLGLTIFAFLLRVWQVGTLPYTLAGDEASQGLEAIRVLNGSLRNPFSTGWLGVPTMSFYFNSWSIALFGPTVFGLRFPWTLVGTATVVVTFFLVRRLVGLPLGLATAVILATYHYHIHYSRLGSNQVADPFFIALALLFLYRGLDQRSDLDWALSGTIAGLGLYFYAGARLTPIVMLAVLAYLFLRQPRQFWADYWRGFLVSFGAFIIIAAPMIQYAIRFPNDFNARMNQVGIIQSGWLAQEMILRDSGPLPILWEQFQRAALAFNYYSDRTVWYGLPEPLLSPGWGVLFLVGMGYALFSLIGRAGEPRYAPLVAWWWGGMLLGGMLTESPPSSQRLITLAVPVSFFLALAIWQIVRLAAAVWGERTWPNWLAYGLLTAVVTLFALGSLRTYFVEYTPQRIYGGPNAAMATEVAPTLRTYSPDHYFYFVGAPWMYWGFATLPYLVPGAVAQDVGEMALDVATAVSLAPPPGKGAVYIFHTQRLSELDVVAEAFPNGRRENVFSPVDGRLMTSLYIVPPE